MPEECRSASIRARRRLAIHGFVQHLPRARHAGFLPPVGKQIGIRLAHASNRDGAQNGLLRSRQCSSSSLAASGCGGNDATLGGQAAGLKCVDDSNVCISQRKQVFDSYMADNSRAWVKQPAGPHEYASGVRLLALSKKRKELSCEELAHGKAEADRAPSALSGGAYSGLTPSQIARGVMLARDVSRELDREIARRCRKT